MPAASKQYVVYITKYFGKLLPPLYIGSSNIVKIKNGYNGSVLSKKWKQIYKDEQKQNKSLFKTRILSCYDTRQDALNEEKRLHIKYNVVKSNRFFNESIARVNGFFGMDVSGKNNPNYGNKWSDEMKDKASLRMKNSDCYFTRNDRIEWYENKTEQEINNINLKKGRSGNKNAFFGKHHTKENILKSTTNRRNNNNGAYHNYEQKECEFCGKVFTALMFHIKYCKQNPNKINRKNTKEK